MPIKEAASEKPVSAPNSASTAADPKSCASKPTPSNAKKAKAFKDIKVKTNGADLWLKAVEKRLAPPYPYKMPNIPFNCTIPDIFAIICRMLNVHDLFKLYMTGDTRLRARLVASITKLAYLPSEHTLTYRSMSDSKLPWPSFISDFNKLREVIVRPWSLHHQKTFDTYTVYDPSILPSSIVYLSIDTKLRTSDVAKLQSRTTLRSLLLRPKWSRPEVDVDFALLPPSLTLFKTTYNVKLPQCVLKESSDFLQTTREDLISEELLGVVPKVFQNLRILSIHPNDGETAEERNSRQRGDLSFGLPIPLLLRLLHPEFIALSLPRVRGGFRPEWITLLPRDLTKFKVNFENRGHASEYLDDYLPALPPSLQEFHILETFGVRSSALAKLPSSITKLTLPCQETTRLELLAGNWPLPNLRDIKLIGTDVGIVIQDLPRTMTSFSSNSPNFGEDLKCLPPNLRYLSLTHVNVTNYFFNVAPKGLTYLELPAAFALTSGCMYHVPPGLTTLIAGAKLQDYAVPYLPRQLTRLELPHTSELSSACVRNLPRMLRILALPANPPFPDSSYEDLPPFLVAYYAHESLSREYSNRLCTMKMNHKLVLQERAKRRYRDLYAISDIPVKK